MRRGEFADGQEKAGVETRGRPTPCALPIRKGFRFPLDKLAPLLRLKYNVIHKIKIVKFC